MTGDGNGKPRRFRLDLSEKTALQLLELKKKAAAKGLAKVFQKAWKKILRRLREDPAGFGELVQRFPVLGLLVHVGSIHPLTVRFAYHKSRRIVYLMQMTLAMP